jgi:hypothetical protein
MYLFLLKIYDSFNYLLQPDSSKQTSWIFLNFLFSQKFLNTIDLTVHTVKAMIGTVCKMQKSFADLWPGL